MEADSFNLCLRSNRSFACCCKDFISASSEAVWRSLPPPPAPFVPDSVVDVAVAADAAVVGAVVVSVVVVAAVVADCGGFVVLSVGAFGVGLTNVACVSF